MRQSLSGWSLRAFSWWRDGAVAGLLAGIVFVTVQIALGIPRRDASEWLLPLERIAAIVLPGYPPIEASAVGAPLLGLAGHLVLSIVFGLLFSLAVARPLAWSGSADLTPIFGGAYGLMLWVVNYYLVAPRAGWVWFPFQTNLFVQAAAHALAFGFVLGLLLEFRVGAVLGNRRGSRAYSPAVWKTDH